MSREKDSLPKGIPKDIDFRSLCGILKPRVRGVTLAQMEETIRRQGAASL